MSVLMVTSVGDLVVDLYTDKCPLTTKNFLKLCKVKYYNGCLFHTVLKDFTAQTGDPTGKGTGGDSIYKFLYGDQARFFSDEIHLELKHCKTGTLSMASAGENLNASQFYFTLRGDDLDYLDGKHTVFGELAEGSDTLTRINESFVDSKGRPLKNIRIKHTYVLDDPFDDPPQLAELIPEASPVGKPGEEEEGEDVRIEDDWVPLDEKLDHGQLEEAIKEKSAHSSATVLELVGDIPDADVKPPDNVLFVCKLNPVTEDEDLHTIFSRFGHVVSSEVIRDYKTGDSLCYAFIEFETKGCCEQAYFKMDNALIDDRRIHVDFSQSVSKLWSKYRLGHHLKEHRGHCFKCSSSDHMAKDCTASSATQSLKYVLKNERGGVDASRYGMIFEGDHGKERRSFSPVGRADRRSRRSSRDKEEDGMKRRRDGYDLRKKHEKRRGHGHDKHDELTRDKHLNKNRREDDDLHYDLNKNRREEDELHYDDRRRRRRYG